MKFDAQYEKKLADEFNDRLTLRELPESYLDLMQTYVHNNRPANKGILPTQSVDIQLESVIRSFKRPSLLVKGDEFDLSDSGTWKEILSRYYANLTAVLPAIGRIEIKNHPSLSWAGTGFLVAHGIVVTNRHVALEFAEKDGQGFSWKTNRHNKLVKARIDFKEEYFDPAEEEFGFTDILHIEPESGPDLALLRVETTGLTAKPLELGSDVEKDDAVATIGYPWNDSRIPASMEEVMQRIFGDIYDVKRLAPGKVEAVSDNNIFHDCTTLRGNSGSAIVDIESGVVVALHYGADINYNLGIRASIIRDRIQEV